MYQLYSSITIRFILVLSFFLFAFSAHAALININTANHSELTTLTGIGDVKAQAIIDYRDTYGPFSSIEEITNVSGIGSVTFENIKDYITVGGESGGEEVPPEESNTELEVIASGSGVFVEDTNSISIELGDNKTVFVGADSIFSAQTFGTKGEPLDNPRVVWSFGDGTNKEGENVFHHYMYPGTYVVIADVSSGKYTASDRITVTAVPAKIAITQVTHSYIALKNNTNVEVNLGGWILFSLGKQFQFPQNTIILSGQEVYVSNKRTGLSGGDPSTVVLQYPNGLVASAYEYPLFVSNTSSIQKNNQTMQPTYSSKEELTRTEEPTVDQESLVTAPIVAADGLSSIWLWLFGVLAFATAGSGAILYTRHRRLGYDVEEI